MYELKPLSEYESNPAHVEFIEDMHAAGIEVYHYHGRFHYSGPAVATRADDGLDLQTVIRATKVHLIWDDLGKRDKIVYPSAGAITPRAYFDAINFAKEIAW